MYIMGDVHHDIKMYLIWDSRTIPEDVHDDRNQAVRLGQFVITPLERLPVSHQAILCTLPACTGCLLYYRGPIAGLIAGSS